MAQRMLPITFLSDYGHEDDFVGVCHGVIQRIAPGAVVIDIAHALPPHDTRTAALVLRNTLRYMPQGVHLAIVDPGVGTERRAVALRSADGRLFVGPDNGLFTRVLHDTAVQVVTLPTPRGAAPTFHGRDLFGPAAAALAAGHALGTLCVIDKQPRQWSKHQVELLTDLAASVVNEIALARVEE